MVQTLTDSPSEASWLVPLFSQYRQTLYYGVRLAALPMLPSLAREAGHCLVCICQTLEKHRIFRRGTRRTERTFQRLFLSRRFLSRSLGLRHRPGMRYICLLTPCTLGIARSHRLRAYILDEALETRFDHFIIKCFCGGGDLRLDCAVFAV